jgi:hypothetical protein
MKIKMAFLPFAIIIMFLSVLLGACDDIYYIDGETIRFTGNGFGYSTNGFLEGTIWVRGNNYISFSRNAVTLSTSIDYGTYSIPPGTYYSYIEGSRVNIADPNHPIYKSNGQWYKNMGGGHTASLSVDRFILKYRESFNDIYGDSAYFFPFAGTLFINGKYRYYNGFGAIETDGGLSIIYYNSVRRDIVLPDEIGGVPVVAIGGEDGTLFAPNFQIASIIIPDSVKTIWPGVFRSSSLLSTSATSGSGGRYLGGGITIGENVTIMGGNAGAGWDQGWGALDVEEIGSSNFVAYENGSGFWIDMGFIRFYNENGRRSGKYIYSYTYLGNGNRTIEWSF